MGRTTNLINGVISGKVGAQVGYRLPNDKQPQGVRAYQPNVRNPKTYGQAAHRAKIRPAQLFYTAFEPVLNHAFFPSGSPGKNRNRFLSLAFRNPVIPRVLKGENAIPYNVPYKVSEGDLALDNYTKRYSGSGIFQNEIAFNLLGYDAYADKISDISLSFLDDNPLLQNGDELTTLVLCSDGLNVYTDVKSLVLDINDNLNTGDYLFEGNCIWQVHGSNDNFIIQPFPNFFVLAAALIISRRTGDTFHYTNSYMCMSQYAIDNLSPSEQAVIESYMSPASLATSPLILQQAQQPNLTPRITDIQNVGFAAAAGYSLNDFSYEALAVAVYSDGFKKIVLDSERILHAENELEYTLISYHSGGDFPATLQMTSLNGSPTVQLSEVQAAGFLLNET